MMEAKPTRQAVMALWAGLFVYALAARLLPWGLPLLGVSVDPQHSWYPWNFSPLTALCVFGGACLTVRGWAFALPLTVLAAGDVGIWLLSGHLEWGFPPGQWLLYLSFAISVGLGTLNRQSPRWLLGVPLAMLGEVLFFLITNFGVWYFGEGLVRTYPPTGSGLLECYVAALPFAVRSLASTFVFATLFFSPLGVALVGRSPKVPQTVAVRA